MPAEPGRSAAAEGHAALAALDRALAKQPARDGEAFTAVTEHLCTMRDLLIAEARRQGGPSPMLVPLNALISTVLAGHFPIGETPWEQVRQARGMLQQLIEKAAPDVPGPDSTA